MTVKPNLRDLLQDHKAKARKSADVRVPWTLDGELADQYDELVKQRDALEASLRAKAALDADDERASGPVSESRSAALVELDEQIAEIKAAGEASTVTLVFRPITATRYDELFNAAKASIANEAEQFDAFARALTAACLVGVEVGGVLDKSMSWEEIVESTDEDGTPLMPFGNVDAIQSMVFAANRNYVDTPFLSAPSARIR